MKKISVLLLILFTVQLCGCSGRIPETGEGVTPISQSALPGSEAPGKDLSDSGPSISTDPAESAVSAHTAETDSLSSQPAESAAADDGYYTAATGIPRADVESYAARVRQLFLEHDWPALSSEISYPITISGVTYNSGEDFIDASGSFEDNLDEAFFSALEEEDCAYMFCTWEGIMLGEAGQVWIGEVLDAEFTSQGLKITAINGLFSK